MGLLIPIGFESGDNSEWHTMSAGGASIQGTTKRTGSYAGKMLNPTSSTPNGWDTQYAAAATDETYVGVYLRIKAYPNQKNIIIGLRDIPGFNPNNYTASIELNSDGTLTLIYFPSNTRTVIGSNSSVLSLDTWYLIEIYEQQTTSPFTITARINRTNFATSSSLVSGLNHSTKALFIGANGHYESCSSGEWYFDDLVINDAIGTTGNTNGMNSWPDEHAIFRLHPNGAGDFAEGAAGGSSPAATGWESVDEVSPNDDIDYWQFQTDVSANSSSADRLDVACEDFTPSTSGIIAVAVSGRVRGATAATTCSWVPRIKSQASGTIQEGTTTTIQSTSWFNNDDTATTRQPKLIQYKDPQNTSNNWTVPLLNSMQIGGRGPDTTPDVWLTQLYADVVYIPAASALSDIPFPIRRSRNRSLLRR